MNKYLEETESWVCQNSDSRTLLLLFPDEGKEGFILDWDQESDTNRFQWPFASFNCSFA